MNLITLLLLIVSLTVLSASSGWGKDAPTFYTPQRVATARQNVEQQEWAKALLARLRAGDPATYYIGAEYGPADALIQKDDDFVWMLMPTTKIPRHIRENDKARCPIHGEALRRLDPHGGFTIDPINHPYKVKCKIGGELWPSNDYAAGDMTGGEYPDAGDGVTRDGVFYPFLRQYAHMAYGSVVVPSLRSLSQAWLITGDKTYARKGAILLAKLAMEYPNHGDRADRLFYAMYPDKRDPDHAWKHGGMITDLIWETFCIETIAYAYDGLYDYMDDDPELIDYLKSKGLAVNSADELRRYIENNILRSGIEALQLGHIHGNPGHHQAAAAALALVLDDYSESKENPFNSAAAVDYIQHFQHPEWASTGHSADIMVNGLDRTGGGEESPNYARIKLDFIRVARLMEEIRARNPQRFPLESYPAIFDGPKVKAIFDFYLDMTIHGYFLPSIGDCGGIGRPQRVPPQSWSYLPSEHFLFAFEKYGEARFAKACLNINTGEPAKGELFEPYPVDGIKSAAEKPEAKIEWKSRLIDGYGVAILDSGAGEHRRAVMLNYTNLLGHQQCDQLMIQLYARGIEMLPDLGYPANWSHRWQWDGNSLAHNTVTIDETQPTLSPNGGHLKLFASRDGVHVAAASHNPYSRDRAQLGKPDAKANNVYQRMVLLVDVDETRFYVVDLFAVNGGEQHDQSWHGLLAPVEDPALQWSEQSGGTLAGANVELYSKWTDRWGRPREDFPAYVSDVRTASISQPAVWNWNSGLETGDALRLHVIPVGGAVTLLRGKGQAPNRPKDWSLDYLLVRRDAPSGGSSNFLSVLDAFQKEPVVKSVRLLSAKPLSLEVELADGIDTIHLNMPLENGIAPAAQSIGARVCSTRNGSTWRDVSVGQWADNVPRKTGFAGGTITEVDYAKNRIAINVDSPAEAYAPGRAIRIFNQSRSAMYRIVDADRSSGRIWLTLDATALLAQGNVTKLADGQVHANSYFTFADGVDDYNRFAGAWLGDGHAVLPVRGAARDGLSSVVHLRDAIGQKKLARYENQVVRLWQYGPGDKIEIVHIASNLP